MKAVLESAITLDPDKEYGIVDGIPEWFWQLPPTIKVIVLTSNDTYGKVIDQLSAELSAGTNQVWLIAPEDKLIIIHYSMTAFKVFRKNDQFTCQEFLPGFSCKVGDLFTLPKRRQ